ncbi:pyruvate kinase [Nematocida parisii]|nr:pyruvate kinase [Nematocida parisii]
MKKILPTKIICTLGPASSTEEKIRQMFDEGMAIARINLSHATGEGNSSLIETINKIRKEPKYSSLSIAMDTKGPEIRLGEMEEAEVNIAVGDTVILTTDTKYAKCCTKDRMYIDHRNIYNDLTEDTKCIFIDDGKIELEIVDIFKEKEIISTKAKSTGVVSSKKGVNIPGIKLTLPNLTENDIKSIQYGIKNGIDLIFASFIQSAKDIRDIKKILNGNTEIKIIAKIESTQGLANIAEIIDESDGIMIARGDLGIETDYSNLFYAQCKISHECRIKNKPFIVATEILESMKKSLKPTRAEVTDLSFAVISGAACVMLSGESAVGVDPVNTVRVMHQIIERSSEAAIFTDVFNDCLVLRNNTIKVSITNSNAILREKNILFGWSAIDSNISTDDISVPNGYLIEKITEDE